MNSQQLIENTPDTVERIVAELKACDVEESEDLLHAEAVESAVSRAEAVARRVLGDRAKDRSLVDGLTDKITNLMDVSVEVRVDVNRDALSVLLRQVDPHQFGDHSMEY